MYDGRVSAKLDKPTKINIVSEQMLFRFIYFYVINYRTGSNPHLDPFEKAGLLRRAALTNLGNQDRPPKCVSYLE
jgi:hypothetical protein